MTQIEPSGVLDSARAQRADVWRHLLALEDALATPVPGRVAQWAANVHDALVDLAATFERHIAVTEGPDGLFDEILTSAPRLEGTVDRLRDEHEDISARCAAELRVLRTLDGAGGSDEAVDVRERLTDLILVVFRHRQAGADLVFDAYAVDIGVGD